MRAATLIDGRHGRRSLGGARVICAKSQGQNKEKADVWKLEFPTNVSSCFFTSAHMVTSANMAPGDDLISDAY